jgi:hypothetical protein
MEFLKWARTQWDRSAAVIAAVAGALALFLGWLGASDNTNPAGQIPYVISGGLVGIFLAALASTLWLSADIRDEWRKLDRLEQRLAGKGAEPLVAEPVSERGTDNESAAEDVANTRRVHAFGS